MILKGMTDALSEKPVPVPFCLAHIPYRLVFGRTQSNGVQFHCYCGSYKCRCHSAL